jgi:hypothetical protein
MTSEVMHLSQNQTMTSHSNNQTTQISALVTPMKKINKLGQKTKVSHPGGSTQNSQTTAFQSRKNAPGSSNQGTNRGYKDYSKMANDIIKCSSISSPLAIRDVMKKNSSPGGARALGPSFA